MRRDKNLAALWVVRWVDLMAVQRAALSVDLTVGHLVVAWVA